MALNAKKKEDRETSTDTTEETSAGTTEASAASNSAETNVPAKTAEAGLPSTGGVDFTGQSSVFITHPEALAAVADAAWHNMATVVADGSHVIQATEVDLGKELKFQVFFVNESKRVVPGDSGDEAKEFFQVSDDGVHVNDGRTLQEALDDAKDAGYEKATIKTYMMAIVLITECENKDFVDEAVILQMAPSSVREWGPLAGRLKRQALRGGLAAKPVYGQERLGNAVEFTSVATRTSWAGNSFTKFVFSV